MSARTSDATREQVIAALRAGSTAVEAARLAGVSHATAVRIARAEGLAGPVGRPVGDADPVTQEIACWAAEGETAAQIAQRLGVSLRLVHLRMSGR